MSLTAGTRLGPYEIVAPIGAGGMGEVFLARDTRLDRSVAIKVLPADFAQNAQLKLRFEREARAISQLNHPNICTLHDIGNEGGVDYLVMELLEGESLADRLTRGAMPIAEVLRFGIQVASALEKAHHAGIVHRDLKPGNIMITSSGAKLLDFGLAKSGGLTLSPDGSTELRPLTAEGTIVGTLQYMAPEQIEGGDADVRSDIFALGVVLYEMASGGRAFVGKTRTSLIAAIVASEPPRLTELQPLAPASLDVLIGRCIAKHPADRWQCAADLRWELLRIQSGLGTLESGRTRRPRAYLGWFVAGAAILLSAWLATVALRRPVNPRPVRFIFSPPAGWTFAMDYTLGPPAVSPDGRYVAFAARDDQTARLQIWLRDLGATQSVPLAGTEGAGSIFWSPTSSAIGFFAGGNLKRVDLAGGAPQILCAAPLGRGGTWSQFNEIVFTPAPDSPLYRVSASGGTARQLTHFDPARKDSSHRWPYFLPDGKHFLFQLRSPSSRERGGDAVYVGDVDSSKTRLLLDVSSNVAYVDAGYLLYLRNRTLLAQRFNVRSLKLEGSPVAVTGERLSYHPAGFGLFSSSTTGVLAYGSGSPTSSLLWLDRHGHSVPAIGTNADYLGPRLSTDEKQILYALPDEGSGNQDLWLFDIARKVSRRLTFHPADDFAGVLTPDGSQLIFSSNRSGSPNLYVKNLGSGDERLLLGGAAASFIESISPDGRTALFRRLTAGSQNDIYAVPVAGGPATPIVASPFNDIHPTFSPDGRWIAYSSDESGRYEVYVTHYPPNGIGVQISTEGGTQPAWRGDEKELFFIAPGDRLTSVAMEVSRDALKPGAASVIAENTIAPSRNDEREYDVTRDGQRFLVNSLPSGKRSLSITVVVNWPSDLRPK